jgi:hypothetical protein
MWKTLATFGLVVGVTIASAIAVTTHVDRSSSDANPVDDDRQRTRGHERRRRT